MMLNLSGIWSGALISRRSSYIVLLIVYEWQTKDKRPQKSNVKWWIYYKTVNIPRIYSFSEKASEFCWSSFTTIIDQENHKIKQIYKWNPHDYRIYYVNIDLRHQYGISVAESQTFLPVKRPSRRGARRNGLYSQATPIDFKFSSARHEAISNRTVSLACFQNDVLKLSLTDVRESGK